MGAQKSRLNLYEGIIYQGETNNNKPHGSGYLSITRQQQQLKFMGKFEHGIPVQGKATYKDLIYEGETKNIEFTGKAILKNKKDIFDGQFHKGQLRKGKVMKNKIQIYQGNFDSQKYLCQDGVYTNLQTGQIISGQFFKGNISGKGSYQIKNKFAYEGQFSGGILEGQGKYHSSSTQVKQYQGNFVHSKPSVAGTITFSNGDKYYGDIKQGYLHGKGSYTYASGTTYEGTFYYNNMTGECQINYGTGKDIQIYEGQVLDGKYNGLGVIHYENGCIYKGYFLQNQRNGPGIIIYGKKMFKCLYVMDRLIGKIQLIRQD